MITIIITFMHLAFWAAMVLFSLSCTFSFTGLSSTYNNDNEMFVKHRTAKLVSQIFKRIQLGMLYRIKKLTHMLVSVNHCHQLKLQSVFASVWHTKYQLAKPSIFKHHCNKLTITYMHLHSYTFLQLMWQIIKWKATVTEHQEDNEWINIFCLFT